MSRLKIVYIVSLVILGVLIILAVVRPMAIGSGYSTVARAHLLQKETESIVEFDIINHEGEDKNYIINVLIDGSLRRKDVLIPNGATFTYVHHIYPDRITEGKASFTIYKEGEKAPLEDITYYVK